MSSISRFVLIDHSLLSFSAVTATLAVAAVGANVAFQPLIFLIASMRIAAQVLFPRRGRLGIISVWLAASMGSSIAQLLPALHALSDSKTAVISSFLIASIASATPLLAIWSAYQLDRIAAKSSSYMFIFPATWTILSALAVNTPFGRFFAWHPVTGIDAYRWLVPYTGPAGIDWIAGAWAALMSELTTSLLMGSSDEGEQESRAVTSGTGDCTENTQAVSQPPHASKRSSVLLLTLTLFALTIPSYLNAGLPMPITGDNALVLDVGCAIPKPVTGGDPPSLKDFIKETKTMSSAHIVLWPEGAVRFQSQEDKNSTLRTIVAEVFNSKKSGFLGLGFEEPVPREPGIGHKDKRRNGFMLLDHTGAVVHQYFKQNLVPFTEDFSMESGSKAPFISSIAYPTGKNARGRIITTPLEVTSAVCFDFASASPFGELESRPALILAPARTWHLGAGLAMWEQAKARAEEVGSVVLWCDGGEGGVSGVGGPGMHQVTRNGPGSWTQTFAIPRNYETKTFYARIGSWPILIFTVVLAGGGTLISGPYMHRFAGGLSGKTIGLYRKLAGRIQRSREGERQPLLIDV